MGLKVENVSKHFGEKLAVDNISFDINKPGVFGLLGTNGAGKSTTIRMMLGILKKDSGEITWNGKKVERKNVNFGYLPEERGIYPKSKIYEQLLYFAELKGMKKENASKEIDYWMDKLKVSEYKNMTAEKLSKGNQQKVQFITAILNDPELIVLDEPFSGLDPVNTELLKEVILELVEKGKYIVMSSHQMTSIEEFCSDVVIINKGKTVLKGNLKEIKDTYKDLGYHIEYQVVKSGETFNENGTWTQGDAVTNLSNGEQIIARISLNGNATNTYLTFNITDLEEFSEVYTETLPYTDLNEDIAYIPKGFKRGITSNINTIKNGLVIEDKSGNQFVWIPVEKSKVVYDESTSIAKSEQEAQKETEVYRPMARRQTGTNSKFYEGMFYNFLSGGLSYWNSNATNTSNRI